jgi:hypothetical protein
VNLHWDQVPYFSRCGGCGRDLSELVPVARYCPHCGVRLDDAVDVPFCNSILFGYAKAMFRLGVHHEVRHNEPEAIRCYDKASRLGSRAADDRLAGLIPEAAPAADGTDLA